jgi:4'-phosphopantetheinyl transferase
VFVLNQAADVTISISHRSGRAICAVASAGVKLGCDLERIEPHTQAFIEDYLTEEEQVRVAQASSGDRARLVTLLWSAKESVLKAMQVGLRVDTRCLAVQTAEAGLANRWTACSAHSTAGDRFHGWWRQNHGWLQTVVAEPPPNRPIQLC